MTTICDIEEGETELQRDVSNVLLEDGLDDAVEGTGSNIGPFRLKKHDTEKNFSNAGYRNIIQLIFLCP